MRAGSKTPSETTLTNKQFIIIMKNLYTHASIQIRKSQLMGNGVFALNSIPQNTLLAYCDPQEFIIYDVADYYQMRELMEQVTIEDQRVLFALYLSFIYMEPKSLKKRPEFDKHIKYLRNLPQQLDNLICWSNQQLQWLDHPKLQKRITEKINKIKTKFDKIKKLLIKHINTEHQEYQFRLFDNQREIQNISLKLLLKMYAVIQSRNLHYIFEYDTQSRVGALVPIIEMFNHSTNSQVKAEYKGGRYEAWAIRKIDKGEEIFVKYGQHQIQQFLQFYGFIPDIPEIIRSKIKRREYRQYLSQVYKQMRTTSG